MQYRQLDFGSGMDDEGALPGFDRLEHYNPMLDGSREEYEEERAKWQAAYPHIKCHYTWGWCNIDNPIDMPNGSYNVIHGRDSFGWHYGESLEKMLAEADRLLCVDGMLVIKKLSIDVQDHTEVQGMAEAKAAYEDSYRRYLGPAYWITISWEDEDEELTSFTLTAFKNQAD